MVVKIGTAVLTNAARMIDRDHILSLGTQVAELADSGHQMILVSSGAIGSGMGELGMTRRPATLPQLQAVASIGQAKLMAAYDEAFQKHGYHAAQILLTRQDVDDRERFLNAAGTMHALSKMKAIPVVNENDTIAVDEIKFGDNDALASLVALMVKADLFIILSCIDGLCRGAPDGRLCDVVPEIGSIEQAKALILEGKSEMGTGGMSSKIAAIERVGRAGIASFIANGKTPGILARIAAGEKVGTRFNLKAQTSRGRKLWIGSAKPRGAIAVDAGAEEALKRRGRSLLATGITAVVGEFARGDVVSLAAGGREFARGISNYSSNDCRLIMGLRAGEIEKRLGAKPYDEVVHCDNMMIL
ncbi:MAG TPA: glutamate 5-kinase [Candidatus Brocadiia bacterium]|nr:glutamate 5-kinase [Candidatus Brocadiia bacterium]